MASSDRNRCGVNGPLSRPTLSSDPLNRCKAASIISGCVSTIPRQTALPDPSITQTAVRLPPTSNPANIVIAALHSLHTNRQRRVSPTPESSNLMYGMYETYAGLLPDEMLRVLSVADRTESWSHILDQASG